MSCLGGGVKNESGRDTDVEHLLICVCVCFCFCFCCRCIDLDGLR